jgi:hypothetical protein
LREAWLWSIQSVLIWSICFVNSLQKKTETKSTSFKKLGVIEFIASDKGKGK